MPKKVVWSTAKTQASAEAAALKKRNDALKEATARALFAVFEYAWVKVRDLDMSLGELVFVADYNGTLHLPHHSENEARYFASVRRISRIEIDNYLEAKAPTKYFPTIPNWSWESFDLILRSIKNKGMTWQCDALHLMWHLNQTQTMLRLQGINPISAKEKTESIINADSATPQGNGPLNSNGDGKNNNNAGSNLPTPSGGGGGGGGGLRPMPPPGGRTWGGEEVMLPRQSSFVQWNTNVIKKQAKLSGGNNNNNNNNNGSNNISPNNNNNNNNTGNDAANIDGGGLTKPTWNVLDGELDVETLDRVNKRRLYARRHLKEQIQALVEAQMETDRIAREEAMNPSNNNNSFESISRSNNNNGGQGSTSLGGDVVPSPIPGYTPRPGMDLGGGKTPRMAAVVASATTVAAAVPRLSREDRGVGSYQRQSSYMNGPGGGGAGSGAQIAAQRRLFGANNNNNNSTSNNNNNNSGGARKPGWGFSFSDTSSSSSEDEYDFIDETKKKNYARYHSAYFSGEKTAQEIYNQSQQQQQQQQQNSSESGENDKKSTSGEGSGGGANARPTTAASGSRAPGSVVRSPRSRTFRPSTTSGIVPAPPDPLRGLITYRRMGASPPRSNRLLQKLYKQAQSKGSGASDDNDGALHPSLAEKAHIFGYPRVWMLKSDKEPKKKRRDAASLLQESATSPQRSEVELLASPRYRFDPGVGMYRLVPNHIFVLGPQKKVVPKRIRQQQQQQLAAGGFDFISADGGLGDLDFGEKLPAVVEGSM